MPADLLLLHGFTQTGASWDGVVRALAGRYRALAPDLGAGPWEQELDRLEALAPVAFGLAGCTDWMPCELGLVVCAIATAGSIAITSMTGPTINFCIGISTL